MADEGGLLVGYVDELPVASPKKRVHGAHGRQQQRRTGTPAPAAAVFAAPSPARKTQVSLPSADAEPAAKRPRAAPEHRELAPLAAPSVTAAATASVFGAQGLVPVDSFSELSLPEHLVERVSALGFTRPTRVQQAVIPRLLLGQDVCVRSDTGSGKTLAYVIPIAARLIEQQPRLSRVEGTAALVLVPTRELCLQVLSSLSSLLLPFHWIVPGAVMGGENRQKEKARLRRGVSFLVATPGRLLDHLRCTTCFCTAPLRWLVLDEADRLLDLGFEEDLTEIHRLLRERATSAARCTALLSATLSPQLDKLVHVTLNNPASIVVEKDTATPGRDAGGAASLSVPQQLEQKFVQVPAKLRLVALVAALRSWLLRGVQRIVVFVSTCESVEFHASLLAQLEAGGEALLPSRFFKLHGSLPQAERTSAFRDFQECGAGILVCTDVAARGLDFPAVGGALQLDPPGLAEDYVHRVGRTARVGHSGEALLFLLPSELKYVELLGGRGVRLAEQPLVGLVSALPGGTLQRHSRPPEPDSHPATFDMVRRVAAVMAEHEETRRLAKNAFRSHVRAYAAHPAASKAIFHVKRLHLGHLAFAFGLKEAPVALGKSGSKQASALCKGRR
jgi:ATP-dependent RNA helicase DDX31/DBP7